MYLNFERCYLLLILLDVTLIKSLLRNAQKSKTTRSLEEIVSLKSDSSVAMSSPLNSTRDILNFLNKALYSIKNLVRLIPNLVTIHK
jgi:hypothetical protein